jgi:hypothetical protein
MVKEATVAQFSVGDHIFRWCSYFGVPFAYQEHAIVLAVESDHLHDSLLIMNLDNHEEQDGAVPNQEEKKHETNTLHDNSDNNKSQTARFDTSSGDKDNEDTTSTSNPCCKIVPQKISVLEAQAQWDHVQYAVPWQKRLLQRAGTCSDATPDPVPIILRRIKFLQDNKQLLLELPYHSHKANGECLALWCTTGNYQSAAGAAKLGETGMHVGSFSAVGGIAAQLAVSVAVSVVVPVMLPFLVAADVGQAVYSGKELHATKKEWQERTILWNEQSMERREQQNTISRLGSVSVGDKSSSPIN